VKGTQTGGFRRRIPAESCPFQAKAWPFLALLTPLAASIIRTATDPHLTFSSATTGSLAVKEGVTG
jgi:hypothetical protein